MTSNGFWVDFDEQSIPEDSAEQYDRMYVMIEGRFNKNRRGHMSSWQGAIENVDRALEKTRSE
jgi:hypothetical protein